MLFGNDGTEEVYLVALKLLICFQFNIIITTGDS
jgi:hypothetical protein